MLISTGGGRAPEELGLGALPANVHVARWYNHGELLPRCAALVTVGGKATVLAAAEAGVPMVVVPTTWDKPDNARRVDDAAPACACPRGAARPSACARRPAGARRAALPGAAQRLAGLLAAAPGPRAARLLEELPASRAGRSQRPLGGTA